MLVFISISLYGIISCMYPALNNKSQHKLTYFERIFKEELFKNVKVTFL